MRVFNWNGNSWVQMGNDIDGGDDNSQEQSGYELSLSSDGLTLAITSHLNYYGKVTIYRWNGSEWNQLGGELESSQLQGSFGWSTSLSSDGNRLAISEPWYNDGFTNTGRVFVYDLIDRLIDCPLLHIYMGIIYLFWYHFY